LDRDREFGEFVDARALVMRRTAYLLCGDWHRAEDIVQTALTKLYVAWSRVRKDSVDAYARKVLVHTAIDEQRRGFFARERTVDAVPELAVSDHSADFDLRRALDALPPGQRAVVVLRYWEDLSVIETARILGRTEGTVKSQAAKGLAALRELLEDEPASKIHTADVIRAGRSRLARRRTAIATALTALLVFSLGGVALLARPQENAAQQVLQVDHNAELTRVLREANVVPPGLAVEDVTEIQAPAFEFRSRDSKSWAAARLRDAQGVGGVTIWLDREPRLSTGDCNDPVTQCHTYERNGIKVFIAQMPVPGTTTQKVLTAEAWRSDGTHVQVSSDNIGRFNTSFWGKVDLLGEPQRPEPVLDREALIKIATLPGLTF
jgi:RNA polymerase sigma-70 factor (sigma-E family)